jgi:quercetin dioxygenase-like cupin family protein
MQRHEAAIAVDVVVPGERTGGAYALIDVRLPAGVTLAPHVVDRETIDLWVLDGGLRVVVDGVRHELAAGEHLRLAPRAPRALTATAATRLLGLLVPAGGERLAAVAADPATRPDDRAALLAAADVRLLPRGLWGEPGTPRAP